MHDPTNPFWRFSLRTYRAPGVEAACLALQERCGADVNLLLFCGWVGQGGRTLDRRRLRQAAARVGAWQSEVVAPLRQARRALKRHASGGPAAVLAPALRQPILALELELEHVEQCLLAELAATWPPAQRRQAPARAIHANLLRYLEWLGRTAQAGDMVPLACLAQACGAGPGTRPGAPGPRSTGA